jgi:head-tail adaptor
VAVQRLRDRIAFERLAPGASDGAGNTVGAWFPIYECAARLRPINGREEILADKLAGVQPFEITVRSCVAVRGLTMADRAIVRRSYQLPAGTLLDLAADQDTGERGEFRSILAKSGAASG